MQRNRLGEVVREIRIDKVRRRNGKRKRASENVRGSLNSYLYRKRGKGGI